MLTLFEVLSEPCGGKFLRGFVQLFDDACFLRLKRIQVGCTTCAAGGVRSGLLHGSNLALERLNFRMAIGERCTLDQQFGFKRPELL